MNCKRGLSIRLMESQMPHRSRQASKGLLCVEGATRRPPKGFFAGNKVGSAPGPDFSAFFSVFRSAIGNVRAGRILGKRRTATHSPTCLSNFADGHPQWVMVNLVGSSSRSSWNTLKRSLRLPARNLVDPFHAGARHKGRAWDPNSWHHAPLAPSFKRRH